jgi:hypothetical protein
MDSGPFLAASSKAPQPRTNVAFKGIAINLGANFGGQHNEAVVFDSNLLRYFAGWTGDFVALNGGVFDGSKLRPGGALASSWVGEKGPAEPWVVYSFFIDEAGSTSYPPAVLAPCRGW